MTRTRALAATTATAFALGALALGTTSASAAPTKGDSTGTVQLTAKLHQLNRSGAQGTATATVTGSTITDFSLMARGLAPSAPDAQHAVHIHYGETAAHECPTMGDASQRRTDGTRRINVADGVPSYGPIAVSLTTTGDTSPASGLALARFPSAVDGVLSYQRSGIAVTDEVGAAIRAGEGVVVVHGVDYNGNNAYDVAGAGTSELAAVPAEATDPALCGVLRDKPGHGGHGHGH